MRGFQLSKEEEDEKKEEEEEDHKLPCCNRTQYLPIMLYTLGAI